MALTKQEILAELSRRGETPRNNMASNPPKEDIEAELLRRGETLPGIGDMLSQGIRETGKDFLSQMLGKVGKASNLPYAESAGQKLGYGVIPAAEQIPGGAQEGLQSSLAALSGEKFQGEQAPEEYGAQAGKSIGRGIGQTIAAAPLIAALRSGLGRAGASSGAADVASTFGGFAATEPGGVMQRGTSGLEAAVIPFGVKALGNLPDALLKSVLGLRKPSTSAIEQASTQLNKLSEEEKLLASEASHKFGISNPERLQLNAETQKAKLPELQQEHANIQPEDFSTMLPDMRHETIIPRIKEELNQSQRQAEHFYRPNENHGQRASTEIVNAIEGKINEKGKREGGVKQALGDLYDEFNKELASKNITVHQTPELKDVQKSLYKMVGGASTDEEKKNLQKIFLSISEEKNINAKDYMTAYRETLRQSQEAYKKAFAREVTPQAQSDWIARGQEIENTAKQMSSVIEDQLGSHYLEKLKAINKRYATEYAPLYKNPLYQEMLQHGRTSKNIAEILAGNTSGNDIIQNQVRQNPELQRLIVGQSLGKNMQGLSSPSENLMPYMQLNPDIAETFVRHSTAANRLSQAERLVPELQKVAEQRKNEFKLRQQEQERRKTLDVEIPKMQYEIKEQERLAAALKRKMEQKNISKTELDRLQKEYSRHVNNRDAIKNRLKGALYTAGIGIPAGIAAYEGKKYLNELFD
jgi:hypothetical protein